MDISTINNNIVNCIFVNKYNLTKVHTLLVVVPIFYIILEQFLDCG